MPNWCFTQYAVTGAKEQLQKLHDTMKELEQLPEPFEPNGFGKTWLGCLVKKLGGDPDQVYCRGEWYDLKWDEKGNLRYTTQTAWHRMEEFDIFISQHFDVELIYCEEESGNEVFNTNDSTGEFFPGKYIIDIEDDEMDYYTEEKALERLSQFFGRTVSSWSEAEKLAEENNDKADEEETDTHIWLHVFETEA